ncbi:hypothetical protein ACFBZI_11345 [Moraxella sp. ZJ142]|uniref:hypothetical protein n=1 Tax=Moraxella marmotae TaxID=3344520 RepID=UPI0035D3E5DD
MATKPLQITCKPHFWDANETVPQKLCYTDEDKSVLSEKIQALCDTALADNQRLIEATKQSRGFDIMAYLDAIHYLQNTINEQCLHLRAPTADDMGEFGVYYHQRAVPHISHRGYFTAHDASLVLVLPIKGSLFPKMRRIFGYHNTLSTDQAMYKDEEFLSILIPFDLTVLIKEQDMPKTPVIRTGETAAELYDAFGDIDLFHHILTPAPIAGLAVGRDLQYSLGYVVHSDILAQTLIEKELVSPNTIGFENLSDTLQISNAFALQMLKERYRIPIEQSYIDSLRKAEDKMFELDQQGKPIIVEFC